MTILSPMDEVALDESSPLRLVSLLLGYLLVLDEVALDESSPLRPGQSDSLFMGTTMMKSPWTNRVRCDLHRMTAVAAELVQMKSPWTNRVRCD